MNLQRIYEEKTNEFIKESLNQVLTSKNKETALEKEVQNSLIGNQEIKNKLQEKII